MVHRPTRDPRLLDLVLPDVAELATATVPQDQRPRPSSCPSGTSTFAVAEASQAALGLLRGEVGALADSVGGAELGLPEH
eukprot:9907471-Alexandrium_andersonii.AAC.1